jgi:UDPglucose--hexose-1-phosphate uridylyltransferase
LLFRGEESHWLAGGRFGSSFGGRFGGRAVSPALAYGGGDFLVGQAGRSLFSRREVMNHLINRLLNFGLQQGLLSRFDFQYSANRLLDVLGEASFKAESIEEKLPSAVPVLTEILKKAVERSLLADDSAQRDLFDARLMDCLTPRPGQVIRRFYDLYLLSPEQATDYFYQMSVASNYIRKTGPDANLVWTHSTPFGDLEISINLSRPAKDHRDLAASSDAPTTVYPACFLCRENEGFAGNMFHPARQNLRLIPLPEWVANDKGVKEEDWFLQYSPYIYYNEHCIFLNVNHLPMRTDRSTFCRLLGILDFLPHYFVGSNADLPIVGGSILDHDHYQGGRHVMPIELAAIEKKYFLPDYPDVAVGRLNWPLSALRLSGSNKKTVTDLATFILAVWRAYSDPELGVMADSEGTRHNAVTTVARRRGKKYELDFILRNNRTSPERPLGIFHPSEDARHLKDDNIGLIEAMGLAVLPPRLLDELKAIEESLKADRPALKNSQELEKHQSWYPLLREKVKAEPQQSIRSIIQAEAGEKFLGCLLDAGVFKRDSAGLAGFDRFMDSLTAK